MLPWLPEVASSFAADIDWLMLFITVTVGVWFIVAEILLVYLCVRWRRREGRRAAYLPARSLRAMAVVLVPCAIILGFDLVIDAVAAPVWHEVKQTLPPHDAAVRIRGEQWAWRITYPGPDGRFDSEDDFEVVNELRVPLDRVIFFELSAKDVLHSLFVRELRVKQDAVPGRTISGWFRPTLEGRFEMVCAEICGFAHTMMKGALVVESPEAHEAWLASKAAPAGPAPAAKKAPRG